MSILEALLLGIIQGLTEFLPVSSSGHIELGKILLNIEPGDNLAFSVIVHGATVLSTVVVFRQDLFKLLKNGIGLQWNPESRYILLLVFSMLPVMVVGILWESEIESFFSGRLLLVGLMLLITATILFLTSFSGKQDKDVGFGYALLIGIAQTIAVMPGISRSGATIGTALILGIKKDEATRFSFLMVLLPIIGATILKVKDIAEAPAQYSSEIMPLMVGFFGAFIAGLFACKWMIALVRSGKIIYFALYCFIVGMSAVIGSFMVA